jgi:hypothetical protein
VGTFYDAVQELAHDAEIMGVFLWPWMLLGNDSHTWVPQFNGWLVRGHGS